MSLHEHNKWISYQNGNQKIKINHYNQLGILVCTSQVPFIDELEFQEIFSEIGEIVKNNTIDKLIFDKRSLQIFDETSMEWYHVHWKKEMQNYGLRSYRKILPNDSNFIKKVEIGRAKMLSKYPDFDFDDYDIKYCNSIDESIKN